MRILHSQYKNSFKCSVFRRILKGNAFMLCYLFFGATSRSCGATSKFDQDITSQRRWPGGRMAFLPVETVSLPLPPLAVLFRADPSRTRTPTQTRVLP